MTNDMLQNDRKAVSGAERQELIDYLHAEQCSCVIRNGKETRVFRERGVEDLYRLLKEEPEFLRGAFVADKVVGKAAAALMILGGVSEVFADVVSRPAYVLFSRAEVRTEYTLMVPHIINRAQTDWCPLEKRCTGFVSADECLPQIEEFMESKKKQPK